MPIALPAPIADYFAADAASGGAVAECFTQDAAVIDENDTYRGHAAIARWKDAATAKYEYRSDPITSADDSGRTVVTALVSGNFPGSPVKLRYAFTLAGDKIASLEILP